MTYLVNDNCVNCKHMTCVEVCPVDCFYEGKNMLVINPDECIDCGVCVPECPVDAIIEEGSDDGTWMKFPTRWTQSPLGHCNLTRSRNQETQRSPSCWSAQCSGPQSGSSC